MNQFSSALAVELCGIRKSYAGRTILDDVSLAVRAGEFFALLGPSGSGKSTLLKMVSGIDVPDEGEVRLAGEDVTATPPYRRRVHTVFQNYALFPHLDVAGNVAFPLRVGGVPKSEWPEKIRRALSWVQMEQHAARKVTDLSGGERQRVALARSLVDEPECVLLDEPLAALDPHLRVQTIELLQQTQSRLGATYLYVTHDRDEALRAAHRIGVMYNGRLVQVGTPEEIYQRPTSPFVAGFIGPMNWIDGFIHQGGQMTGKKRAVIGVRPENIRLGSGDLAAEVVSRQYSGASVSLHLSVNAQWKIVAEVSAETDPPQIGQQVKFSWDSASMHVFHHEEGAVRSLSLAARIDDCNATIDLQGGNI